ncbi:hypothetical protein TELCIR_05511 [Teladorsagia circumcincta]|uniref:Uncharacterized protein n=1 Tax=Teladorsagia circumcincta TaxID=45464 RepID=A0A2G9UQL4_TELCI|nr:hypothetical protein TELCIR_05511 [Teladorsagia circumcincta]
MHLNYFYLRALEFIAAFIGALAESSNEDSVASICRKSYEGTLSRAAMWHIAVVRKSSSFPLTKILRSLQAVIYAKLILKVAPNLALTPFGGLLSAGAETVLCKFTLSGAGRPNMLPHLAAPVRDLAISDDASHLAVILGSLFIRERGRWGHVVHWYHFNFPGCRTSIFLRFSGGDVRANYQF